MQRAILIILKHFISNDTLVEIGTIDLNYSGIEGFYRVKI